MTNSSDAKTSNKVPEDTCPWCNSALVDSHGIRPSGWVPILHELPMGKQGWESKDGKAPKKDPPDAT